MENNMIHWDAMCRPPKEALKRITGGRLNGKTDIKPQWRMKAMTEHFGSCGVGWKYEIVNMWTVDTEPERMAFCQVNLYYKDGDKWSEPIPGIGGSMLTAKEKAGLYNSDEAYKMSLTDALSVAMKAIGVAADIYEGKWDGSKYIDNRPVPPEPNRSDFGTPDSDEKELAELKKVLAKAVSDMLIDPSKMAETISKAEAKSGEALTAYVIQVIQHINKLRGEK